MNKFMLADSIGIDLWCRKSLETFLFDPLLCSSNLLETSQFLKVLDTAREMTNSQILILVKKDFAEAEKFKQDKNYSDALIKLNNIITKAPKTMEELRKALVVRANIYLARGNIEKAILDYEICVHLIETNENSCYLEELIFLTDLYGQVGDFEKFKINLDKMKSLYEKQLVQVKSKKSPKKNQFNIVKNYGNRLKNFEKKLKKFFIQTCSLPYKSDESKLLPYEGYKGSYDPKISSASVACTLRKDFKKYHHVLANRFIPYNEIVIVESCSLDREFYSPDVQCDYCMQSSTFMFSCFECRFKSYCSLNCMQCNYYIHKYECIGYQNSLILMLNAGLLYRIFIRTLLFLKQNVFDDFNDASDINDFFEIVMNKLEKKLPESKLKKLLTTSINYENVDNSEMLTMITSSVRLTVFICEKTEILTEFFNKIKFLKIDIMVFIAALLLRLQYQIKLNTIEMNYTIKSQSYDVIKCKSNFEKSELLENFKSNPTNGTKRILEYYTYNNIEATTCAAKILVQHFKKHENVLYFKSVKTIDFARKYIRLVVNEACYAQNISYPINANDLNFSQKSEFILNAAIVLLIQNNNFLLNTKEIHEQTLEGIYPTTKQFQHSCDPNVILILLQSGTILGKTIREIKPGEELTISYGAHYKEIDQLTRKTFLKKVFINCNCKHCNCETDFYETNNTIYCYNCRKLIVDTIKCTTCNIDKSYIERIYESINKTLDEEELEYNNENNEEKFFKHLISKMCMYFLMYPETNRKMFKMKMKLAEFCVCKNFVSDSFTMLKNLVFQASQTLPSHSSSLMLNYFKISEMLMDILKYNMTFNLDFVNGNIKLFYEIVFYTIMLIKKELCLHDFLEIFDENTVKLLNNYQILMAIKQTLFFLEYPARLKDLTESYELDNVPILYDDAQVHKDLSVKHRNGSKNLKKEDLMTLLKLPIFGNEEEEFDALKIQEIVQEKNPTDNTLNKSTTENCNLKQSFTKFSIQYDDEPYEIISNKNIKVPKKTLSTLSNQIEINEEKVQIINESELPATTFYEEVIEYFCNEIEDRKLENQIDDNDFDN